MAISRGTVPFLVAMMLLTGVCNTLVTKYQVRAEKSCLWRYGKTPRFTVNHSFDSGSLTGVTG